jgi:ribonucrease Y
MNIIGIVLGILIGGVSSFVFFGKRKIIDFEKKQEESKKLIEKSKEEAHEILETTKKTVEGVKKRSEEDKERRERYVKKLENSIKRKEQYVKKNEGRNRDVQERIKDIEKNTTLLEKKGYSLEKETTDRMAAKIGSTVEKEKTSLLDGLKRSCKLENKKKVEEMLATTKENAEKEAREILVSTMQRLSSPTSVEKKGREIKVDKDFKKGRIVGRDAKNILFLEEELEVNIIFNDAPNIITVASFNLLNQHIAAKTIKKLLKFKGEIRAEDLKKVIADARKETEGELEKIGKEISDKLKFKNTSKKLYELIGRLKFRTSYGQNILKHSMEVASVSMMLGSELGVNVEVCKVAGFLHDLGKAIDQDPNVKGAHDFLTKELMEELGFSEEEVHAAWTHHESEPAKTIEAMIVKAADAVSAGRPGARQETLDKYLERLKALEKTATSFAGVKKTFAISAGREIRVIVDPNEVTDEQVREMAKRVAAKIEEDLAYPGKIKVNVIRRVKALDTAR